MSARLVRHPDAAALVARRAKLLAALRAWLDARGFLEADVPPLAPHAGQEPHLRAPRVTLDGLPGPLFLQTSPELALKRLVCAGVPRVYALGFAFRGGRDELSTQHQPQFTMLEWYRPGTRVEELVEDVVGLVGAAAAAVGVAAPAATRVLTLREAFEEFAGVDLGPLLDGDVAAFAAGARRVGVDGLRDGDDAPTAFGRVLVARVEPALGRERGLLALRDWPAFGAALARLSPQDPRVALRVEAYLGGVELANGYVELADAQEHRRRWREEAARRDDPAPPWDEGLLADLAAPGLPECVGMALGVDRLLMALLGARRLADVLPLHLETGT
jgi:elongation factor P--(R)-beta-lysine ligase